MLRKPDYTSAIQAINADAEFKMENNDLSTIEWLNGTSAISDADIEAKMTELNTEYTNSQYERDRREAFQAKSIKDQLDMMYHDEVDGTTTWKDWVASVKAAHPKPTE